MAPNAGSVLIKTLLTVIAFNFLLSSPAKAADDVYLGLRNDLYRGFGTANESTWALYKLNVTSAALITAATAATREDPAVNRSKIVVYPNLNAGTAGWSPIATFTQNSYGDFDAVNGAYSVTYTGSYAFAPGTYWVGVAAVTGSPGYHAAQGIQPSPWTWDTNPGNELLTINTGSTWATYSFSASPMITLLIPSLDVNGGSTSSAPADLLQQIAVPSSGTCADVQDESLRWGTGLSGGWQLTWAQWMNAGKGGAVCTRTLVYGTALGRWVVG